MTTYVMYVDPSTAQFLSLDPMVATTISPYAYVAGNPLNAIDPSGMCPWGVPQSVCDAASAAAGAASSAGHAVAGAAGAAHNKVTQAKNWFGDRVGDFTKPDPGSDFATADFPLGFCELTATQTKDGTATHGVSFGLGLDAGKINYQLRNPAALDNHQLSDSEIDSCSVGSNVSANVGVGYGGGAGVCKTSLGWAIYGGSGGTLGGSIGIGKSWKN